MDQTKKLLRDINGKFNPPKLTPIATEMYLPNHSGNHDAGIVLGTPSKDTSIVNKKYVDDQIAAIPAVDLTPYAKLDGTNQPFTGDVNISKASAKLSLTDSGAFNIQRVGTATLLGDVTGDTRGTDSVDFQITRTATTQVAATSGAIVIGKRNTTGNGNSQFVFGEDNLVYGRFSATNADSRSAVIGAFNTIGQSGIAVGGYQSCVLGISNNVCTKSTQTGNFVVGKANTVDGSGSAIVGQSNQLGVGQQSYVLGASNFLYGSAVNVVAGVNNLLGSGDNYMLCKNSYASGGQSAIIGGYHNVSGSASTAIGFTNTTGYARRTATFTVGATTCTISGDVTAEFATGNSVAYYYTQNNLYQKGSATLTNVSYSSPNTTLTRSGNWVTDAGTITGGYINSSTKGSGSTAIGNTVIVRSKDSVAIGKSITTLTDSWVQLGTSNTKKFTIDNNGYAGVLTNDTAPAYPLDVVGDINTSTGYRVATTAGATGSFTTADGKTVTVTGGIITAIV